MSSRRSSRFRLRRLFNTDSLGFYFALAALILLTVECFARRSILSGLTFPFVNPFAFIVNYGIILLTLLPTLLGRRRVAWLVLISLLWISLGVAEFILLSFRVTPLTAVDFSILPNVLSIISIYLSPFQIVLIATLLVIAILLLVFLFLRVPKHRIAVKKTLVSLSSVLAVFLLVTALGLRSDAIKTTFPNLSNAYRDYGFAYCFSMSVFDKGVDKPESYSEEEIDRILQELPEEKTDDDLPNVIVVQLESLFNVNRLTNVEFSEDPLPTYTYLLEAYQSGLLTVPVIGAGTINTEFEMLTGMSVLDFGAGEYPYKSILKDTACESIAYTLTEAGLTAHAIHNHEGSFYKRNEIYRNLGFSSFTSIEYMLSPTYNETLWAKDEILTDEINRLLSSTEGRDFIFTVSVQGHGKYPTDYEAKPNEITVTKGLEDDPEKLSQYTYYINQLHETDAFIRELYEQLMASDEPTVLLLYGDHFPALSIDDTMLSSGTVYETEYILISNYDESAADHDADLASYQLYPMLMERLGCQNGLINRFHQTFRNDADYSESLRLLEYDLLYGENYADIASDRYETREDMQLGVSPVTITDCRRSDDFLLIKGQNFTPYSIVALNGTSRETEYLDSQTLRIELPVEKNVYEITVRQTTKAGIVLSESEPYLCYISQNHIDSLRFTRIRPHFFNMITLPSRKRLA